MAETYTPLASSEDVVKALGRDLTSSEQAKVDVALAKASELFRNEARRTFTRGRKTARLKVSRGEVHLPESPVVTVHSVTDDHGHRFRFTHFGVMLNISACAEPFVRVDYEFGDDKVPELVVTTVAEMVAATFGLDKRARAGMTQFQDTTGPFSDGGTFAAWAVGGKIAMSPADLATAQSFRPVKLGGTVTQGG
ncbi:hypothetical protein [Microbacterium sp. NPDC091676]|uniref:hypothetical protein n=1 Tax=Microbacterium sp. NPDC091676 TaxID=3364212 RepID=UPI0038108DD1